MLMRCIQEIKRTTKADRQTSRHSDRQTNIEIDKQMHGWINREKAEIQTETERRDKQE